jgi:hypothetical protein
MKNENHQLNMGEMILRDHHMRALHSCQNKEVDDLTEEEKFAIAVAGGAPIKTRVVDGMLQMTTVPCGIIKKNGTFRVLIRQKDLDPSL